MSDQPDSGFDEGAVLTPEQLAELLAGMPDLDDPHLPDLPEEPTPEPARGTAPPMIGFVDGPTDELDISARGRRPPRVPLPDSASPALDPAAADSLSWLFR